VPPSSSASMLLCMWTRSSELVLAKIRPARSILEVRRKHVPQFYLLTLLVPEIKAVRDCIKLLKVKV
jgi:hypothetical protein